MLKGVSVFEIGSLHGLNYNSVIAKDNVTEPSGFFLKKNLLLGGINY